MSKYVIIGLFIQCLVAGMLLANTSVGQHKSLEEIYVQVDWKNVKVKEAFTSLNTMAGFSFTYFETGLNTEQSISLKSKKISLAEVLRTISEEANLHFKRVNSKIYVKRKDTGFESNIEEIFMDQNQQKVTGTVTSAEDGGPLPGVSILIKGTESGTTTDFNGNFTLEVPDGKEVLVFSFIGFQSKEILVNNQAVINVELDPDLEQLEEVVVIGYGSVKKSDLTGSVSSLEADEIKQVPLVSIDQGMQGRLPGVFVTQSSSAPGGGVTVRVRGNNTLNGGNEPLYVIDGFPVITSNSDIDPNGGRAGENGGGGLAAGYTSANALSSLNPNDIESIEVLKDASATAIYGSRGSNGVVIITTKRGKAGETNISYEMYAGVQQVANTYDVMNATEFVDFANDFADWKGHEQYFDGPPSSYGEGTNWQNELFVNAPIQNHQLTATGGTEKFRYAISGSYFDQQGIIKNSGFKRYSFRTNLDAKVNNKLSIGNSLLITRTVNNRAFTEGSNAGDNQVSATYLALFTDPTLSVRDDNGNYQANNPNTQLRSKKFRDSPITLTDGIDDETIGNRILGNVFANYKFTNDLSLKVSLGADIEERQRDVYYNRISWQGQVNNGDAFVGVRRKESIINENVLSYNTSINDIHEINAIAGFSWQVENAKGLDVSAFDFTSDLTQSYALGSSAGFRAPSSFLTQWQMASFFGRINYTLKDKYLFTASLRADGSSKFGPNNKWGYFPSGAFAWRLGDEDFIQSLNIFSDLKLRASYGVTGNQEIGTNQYLLQLATTNVVFGDGIRVGNFPVRPSNPDLKWEESLQTDIGLNMAFLDNRLRFEFDYFIKNTNNLLLAVALPSSSGFNFVTLNAGEVRNQGVDLHIGADIINNGNFSWTSDLNYSRYRNEVVDLGPNKEFFAPSASLGFSPSRPSSVIRVGEPIGSFYGWNATGIFSSQEQLDAHPWQPDAQLGDPMFEDVNGDGAIGNDDRTVIGDPNPDFLFGWTNVMRYSNFELRFFIQGVLGNDVYHLTKSELQRGDAMRGNKLRAVVTESWSTENPDGKLRALRSRHQNFQYLGSNLANIEDGSYIRLRDITLSYDLNFEKGISNARIYLTAQNLFTFTNYSGFNPDVNNQGQSAVNMGYDIGSYPLAKSFILGVNINF